MYTTTSRNEFIDKFISMGRADTGDGKGGNFTIEGLDALFDYLEQWEDDIGEPVEFDPIALCCQFSEYVSAAEAVDDVSPGTVSELEADLADVAESKPELFDAVETACNEWLMDHTIVIAFNGGIIIDSEF